MTNLVIRVLITAFAIVLVAEIIPGIEIDSAVSAIFAALVIGILNVLIRPLLVLLTLPITILTLGLFIFIINAFLFWVTASFIDGFSVSGFIPAFFGSLIVSAVSTFINKRLT